MSPAKLEEARQLIESFKTKPPEDGVKAIVAIFKRFRPTCITQCTNMGLKVKYLGSGVFREVYRIGKYPVVGKFPFEGANDWGDEPAANVYHSNHEIATINKIKRDPKLKALRPFIPQILYHDKKTGVILVPEYKKLNYRQSAIVSDILGAVTDALGISEGDLHNENLGQDKHGAFKILDLGIFE